MGKKLVYNTALLTGSSLLMRCIGMAFQAWLAGRIGATGIGLFQLVMSVEMLCTTLAVSGIRFAATRIVAEEIGSGREGAVGTAVFRCCMYSLLFGCAAAAVPMRQRLKPLRRLPPWNRPRLPPPSLPLCPPPSRRYTAIP